MGQKTTDKSNVQSLANKTTDGNVELLASKMNDFSYQSVNICPD